MLLDSCSKQDEVPLYDLFPLEVGNEFYYKYYKYRYIGILSYTSGIETWKVVPESSQDNSKIYRIERKLNGTVKVANQTIIPEFDSW